jgi:hypothetical protein
MKILLIILVVLLSGCNQSQHKNNQLDVVIDSDGDGISDNKDAFPNDPTEWNDYDLDLIGDNKDKNIFLHESVGLLQEELDKNKALSLKNDVTYLFDKTLLLRDYSNVKINGNGATIKRSSSKLTSSYLSIDYEGGFIVHVDNVPPSLFIGDKVVLTKGYGVKETSNPYRVVAGIHEGYITIDNPFKGEFKKGDMIMKSFFLIEGMHSHVDNGTNKNILIENLTFDGNARENQVSAAWHVNGTILIHGGKDSVIRNNVFTDIPNECIVGHGVNVINNTFEGLNGSAFHTSVHDKTLSLNGYSVFKENTVFDINRIEKGLSGHSEGAITFSWGGGNLKVVNNIFVSYSGNYGVLGQFAGEEHNTDENLIFTNNQATNFEYIIKIISPEKTPTKNISIINNEFHDAGFNDFSHLSDNKTIRFGCNTLTGNTAIIGNKDCSI